MKRSYTEETRDQIIRNPLNDSTSKTSYSFGKSQRFKTEKNICPHVAYDINLSTNRKRKASFGYGKRTDFVMSNQFTPAPLTYSIDFVRNKQKEGFSFGANREQTANGSYIPLGRLKVRNELFRIQVQGTMSQLVSETVKTEDILCVQKLLMKEIVNNQ